MTRTLIDAKHFQALLLDLMEEHTVITAVFAAKTLGVARQKTYWHLKNMASKGQVQQLTSVETPNLQLVWASTAKPVTLTEEQIANTIRLQMSPPTVAETAFKTRWANGINPWTGAAMK